ncbi:MAG: hypothetical protein GXY51_08215 [Bacteroidetes bacterium]|nr:hypothetical protein [Bacteroidota bacterium]
MSPVLSDSFVFYLLLQTDNSFICRQIPKSLKRVGERKNYITMKELTYSQMEVVSGSRGCGKVGAGFSVAAGVFMMIASATNPLTIVGGIALGYSIATGIVGVGCGLAELAS